MDYADMGFQAVSAGHQTGWTPPTVLWERMRDVDNAATSLDVAIRSKVKRQFFLDSWASWFRHWKDLVERYDSTFAKAGSMFYSDELASEIEQKRIELHNWEDAYRRERPEGAPENPPIPGMPTKPPNAPEVKGPGILPKLEIPWWVWLVGGGVMIGLGALIYHRVRVARSDPRFEGTVSRYGLPGTAKIDRAREITESKALSAVGRDHDYGTGHQYGTVIGGMRMCPCPNQGLHQMATYNPED